jgi:hypothetical protein
MGGLPIRRYGILSMDDDVRADVFTNACVETSRIPTQIAPRSRSRWIILASRFCRLLPPCTHPSSSSLSRPCHDGAPLFPPIFS